MCNFLLLVCISLTILAQTNFSKIWDDKALEGWATPIAALGVVPTTSVSLVLNADDKQALLACPQEL